jgi:predicted AAA+ superfamily ATPase
LAVKLRAQKVSIEELVLLDEIHDLLRWSDWIRAYRATAEFFDRKLPASGERQ